MLNAASPAFVHDNGRIAALQRAILAQDLGRIAFAGGCFRTSVDVVAASRTRAIPRKSAFHAAMQNAHHVFESVGGRRCPQMLRSG